MAITPLDVRKMEFPQKLRGYHSQEVDDFLVLVAEELTARLGDIARLEQENREFRRRLDEAAQRQHELQEAMLQTQKLSQEITDNAKQKAALLIKEAEVAADAMVSQAVEQANRMESKIVELRAMRRDLQLKLRNMLEMYRRALEEEMEDERTTAIIRTLPRRQQLAS